MDKKRIFADGIRWFPYRLLTRNALRRFLVRKAHTDIAAVSYSADLASNPARLVILPDDDYALACLFPLLARLVDSDKCRFLASERLRPLLKVLELDSRGIFHTENGFLYGTQEFQALEQKVRSQKWDALVLTDPSPHPLKLYLALASHAPLRLGVQAENHFPFLNISFRPLEPSCPYSWRSLLCRQLGLDEESLVSQAREWQTIHGHVAHQQESQALSSHHTILLNMEADRNGSTWSHVELQGLSAISAGKYRLLALFHTASPPPEQLALLEKLQIRTAPLLSSSGALIDMIRQYHGMISLDSAHAHLVLSLTQKMVMIFAESGKDGCARQAGPGVKVVDRAKGVDLGMLKQTFG